MKENATEETSASMMVAVTAHEIVWFLTSVLELHFFHTEADGMLLITDYYMCWGENGGVLLVIAARTED